MNANRFSLSSFNLQWIKGKSILGAINYHQGRAVIAQVDKENVCVAIAVTYKTVHCVRYRLLRLSEKLAILNEDNKSESHLIPSYVIM